MERSSGIIVTQLANPTILLNVEETVKTTTDPPKIPSKKPDFHVYEMSRKTNESSTIDMFRFRKNIETNGYSEETTEIIVGSWKNNTKSKYNVYLKQWEIFCKNENINTSITLK